MLLLFFLYNNITVVSGQLPKLCQGLLFFILQCIIFISYDSQNVFEGKYVKRYFNKQINRCIISKLQDSQICNVGNDLLL